MNHIGLERFGITKGVLDPEQTKGHGRGPGQSRRRLLKRTTIAQIPQNGGEMQ